MPAMPSNHDANISGYLYRGAAWVTLFNLELVATIILSGHGKDWYYHPLATVLAVVVALALPRLGRDPLITDLTDLCWYDVGVQLLGWMCAKAGWPLAPYATLACAIYFIKLVRIFWPAVSARGEFIPWPRFGMCGLLAKDEVRTPNTGWGRAAIGVAVLLALGVGELQRRYTFDTSVVFYGLTSLLCLVYTRPLLARLAAQQAAHDVAIAELAIAQERARSDALLAASAAELAEKNAQLEAANAELVRVNEQLDRANNDLTDFNYHLRTINDELASHRRVVQMTNHDAMPMINFTHFYCERAKTLATNPEQIRLIDAAMEMNAQTSERLARIIGIQRPSVLAEMSRYASVDVINDVVDLIEEPFMALAKARGGEFGVRGWINARVWSNAEYLQRILSNLIKNALIHNPPGTRVHLLITRTKGGCMIRVLDTGHGMPEATAARDRNFAEQVEHIIARTHGNAPAPDAADTVANVHEASHGVGLRSVVELAAQLRISVRLYRRLGLGAVFEFYLEAAARPVEQFAGKRA